MTADLPAGEDTNARIHTRVMQLPPASDGEGSPDYTGDIAAAWDVVERMRALGFYVTIMTGPNSRNRVAVEWFDPTRPDQPRSVIREADTAPLAICRAALAAMR